jgi:hypothetical protein
LLALDARWRRFNDPDRSCPCCGARFSGIYDLGFEHPDDWPHAPRDGQDMLEVGQDRLTADLCRISGRYFLRATMVLPVRGADDGFAFGPWAEVSHETFHAYLATCESQDVVFAPQDGILANALPGFEDSLGDTVTLDLKDPTQRPALAVEFGSLADAQEDGISFDDLLDIYAAAGNDIRPHLTQD